MIQHPQRKSFDLFVFWENCLFIIFFKDFIYSLSERGEGREKVREKNINVEEKHRLADPHLLTPNQGLAHNPGMCPDQEPNQRPFTLLDDAQHTETCQLRLFVIFLHKNLPTVGMIWSGNENTRLVHTSKTDIFNVSINSSH